jgi:hypothetical protein
MTMPIYQLYGGQLTVPLLIEFASDEEAISKAKQLFGGMDLEIRDGSRLVLRLSKECSYHPTQAG